MTKFQPVHPTSDIALLSTVFLPHAFQICTATRLTLPWVRQNKAQIYVLESGTVSLLRQSDRLLTATVTDPHIFGLSEMLTPTSSHLLRVDKNAIIWRIDADTVSTLLHSHDLWQHAALILAYHTQLMIYRDEQVLQRKAYSVIRNLIIEMSQLTEEQRSQISILQYIRERTGLSRSSILNAVAEYSKMGFIGVSRGAHLTYISHIPERWK